MKLKCIGGPCNNKIQEVCDYYREHDQIQIMGTIEFRLIDFEEELKAYRESRIPDEMAVPYHYYKISIIKFSIHNELKFLIPMNWTSEDAIRFKLGC